MQRNNTDCNLLMLVLARRADSLCSVIPSWALACRWGDLVLCHSPYELLARLADLPPKQSPILLGRPVMFTAAFVRTALQICPSLRLIAWTTIEQTATDHKLFMAANLPVVTVSSPDELTSLIAVLEPANKEHREPAAIAGIPAAADFDPKEYTLSSDEVNALLGADS